MYNKSTKSTKQGYVDGPKKSAEHWLAKPDCKENNTSCQSCQMITIIIIGSDFASNIMVDSFRM